VSTEEQRIERRNAEWRRDAELGHISVHRFRTLLADVERLTEERDALAAAMFAAADELDAWDGDASTVLDGHSPGGVIRHAILALDGDA